MTYKEFIASIDKYIECIVEFTVAWKDGHTSKMQRTVWDKNSFCDDEEENEYFTIINVEFVRKANILKSDGLIASR